VVTNLKFHAVENVTFRYAKDTKHDDVSLQLVPKIMHHILLHEDNDDVPSEYDAALDSCFAPTNLSFQLVQNVTFKPFATAPGTALP